MTLTEHSEPLRKTLQEIPDPALLRSMACRYDHSFGLKDEQSQKAILTTMYQPWEEMVGLDFYKPDQDT